MVRVICDYAFLESYSKINIAKFIQKESYLEKYIFIQKLLKKNLYISKDIDFIIELNKSKAGICNIENQINDDVILSILNLQKNNQNEISSDIGLIAKIKQLPNQAKELQPFDIILIKADLKFCQMVSERYGILCIGINYENELFVNTEMTQVNFEATNNLFDRFCKILEGKKEITNKAIVIDQHFFSNNRVSFKDIYSSISNRENKFLSIHFCDNPKNLNASQKSKNKEQVYAEIKSACPQLSDKVTLYCINKFDYHDRYLIIGTKIFIAGNSLSTPNCRSYLSSFPFALYFDNLPKNIKELIEKTT
jgi:hypothetical protein